MITSMTFNLDKLGFFIVGFAHETKEDCINTCKTAAKLGFDYIYITLLAPYPETAVYTDLLKMGKQDHWLEHAKNPTANYHIPNMHPTLNEDELNVVLDQGYKNFYFSPGFLIKELFRTKHPRTLLLKSFFAIRLFFNKSKKVVDETAQSAALKPELTSSSC